MRGQLHLRRAGMVSAGTLALVLTSVASPAAADEVEDQNCEDGDGLLSTVTGVVCDTTDTVTDTTTGTLDKATGGATEDLSDDVKGVTGGATGAVHEATQPTEDGDDAGTTSRSGRSDQSGEDSDRGGSDSDGGGGTDSDGTDSDGTLGAAGFPAGARSQAAGTGGGMSPYLQPLSPLAGLHPGSSPDGLTAAAQPNLPEIAPSPVPRPEPAPPANPEITQYAAPAGEEEPYDRGEATPAMMVIFAIIAAGVVTGGHVAVAQARVRSRRVG